MKRTILKICTAALFLASCNGEGKKAETTDSANKPPKRGSAPIQSVSIAEANSMLGSYLTSIDYQKEDTELHSWIVNADSLRSYLNDTSRGKIQNIKIMLSHTPEYVKVSSGQNCGYKVGALTVIIAGYDSQNNYIYDHLRSAI